MQPETPYSSEATTDRTRLAWAAAFYLLAMAAQMSGYTNGWVALVLAAIATCIMIVPSCHHIARWHKRREEAGKVVIEPHHLLIAGLSGIIIFAAIALSGVIWQQMKPTASASRMAVVEPTQRSPKPNAIEAAPPVQKPTRYYSTADKDRIAEALFKISEILSKEVSPLPTEAQHLISRWETGKDIGVGLTPSQIGAESLPILEKLLASSSDASRHLLIDLYKEYQDYSEVLNDVTFADRMPSQDQALARFIKTAREFMNALTMHQKVGPVSQNLQHEIVYLINPIQNNFRDAVHNLTGWMDETRGRIAAKRLDLQK